MQLEREKLDVLKDIRQCLQEANERDNNFQQQLIELKKAKLALEERRLALEEMSFARPSISVPIILPEDTGNVIYCFSNLCNVKCFLYVVMTHLTVQCILQVVGN